MGHAVAIKRSRDTDSAMTFPACLLSCQDHVLRLLSADDTRVASYTSYYQRYGRHKIH